MNKILYSKKSDNWKTPNNIYKSYINQNYFDPCPYESKFNGLEIEWKDKNFVNPPYSKIKEWVEKAIKENKKGKIVVLLIPARTDTKYFKKIVDHGASIVFITGRLKFNETGSAPFPNCLINLIGDKITRTSWVERENLC